MHSFYLQHNIRRNSDYGREIMLSDLDVIHDKLLEAYKALLLISGVDLDKLVAENPNYLLRKTYLSILT